MSFLTVRDRTKATPVRGSHPTEEEMRIRAYELFLERGDPARTETEDWLRAERELTAAARREGAAV